MNLSGWVSAIGAVVTLLTAFAGLWKLLDEREKVKAERKALEAERRKVEAERERVEAEASEKITRTALLLVEPLSVQVRGQAQAIRDLDTERARLADAIGVLQKRLRDVETEKSLLMHRVAAHEEEIEALRAERDAQGVRITALEARISELEDENGHLRALLRAHDIDIEGVACA